MAQPDYVQEVLDYLSDNWNTSNFSPTPTFVDGDEMRIDGTGARAKALSAVEENIITVDSEPTAQGEPIGTEFDFRMEAGATVVCEGYHVDGGGQLADKDAFDSMVGEARRAILTERKFPVGELTWLTLENENDLSAQEPQDANYFRFTFDVIFHGFETLP